MDEEHPPKAQMVLRVGVTGHRWDSLQEAGFDEALLRPVIRKVLTKIQNAAISILKENKDVYSSGPPVLRVISPLAEGADRFVAEEALALGYELQSPLPFSQEEYEEDFIKEESKLQFRELLKQATSILTLAGSRQDKKAKDRAYEEVGRVVLRQSDLLIAIWNGHGAQGQGGTGQIVKEALERKTPILWIGPNKPHSVTLLEKISEDGEAIASKVPEELEPVRKIPKKQPVRPPSLKQILLDKEPEAENPVAIPHLDARLREILALPDPKQVKSLYRFLRETQPQFRAAVFYRVFCKTFVPKWKLPNLEVESFKIDREEEWLRKWMHQTDTNPTVGRQVEQRYRSVFVWSDVIADIFADRYRSSFVATYLLGALAVLAAFLGAHPQDLPTLIRGIIEHSHDWFWVELILISSILLLVWLNRVGRWHERWIDYRLLAEGLRQMRVLAPFGRVTPAFEVPAHLSEDISSATWFNWYFRAIARSAGLVAARVDKSYLEVCRGVLVSEILSQTRYHKRTEERFEALHKGLHHLSIFLFICTFFACVAHIFLDEKWIGKESFINGLLTLFAIVFPAFGAAIQGILHQGEFGRIARRSRAIRNKLRELLLQIRIAGRNISFHDLGRTTESFSKIQILEQADWRSVFIIKEISLP